MTSLWCHYDVIKFEKLNIHEVTEHVTSLLEAETHGNFQFTRDYDPSIPELNGDKSQLIQAVLNVSRNALQALHEADIQQPKITVRTRVQRNYTISDNRYRFVCRVDVIDNGPGIRPDMTEDFFPSCKWAQRRYWFGANNRSNRSDKT